MLFLFVFRIDFLSLLSRSTSTSFSAASVNFLNFPPHFRPLQTVDFKLGTFFVFHFIDKNTQSCLFFVLAALFIRQSLGLKLFVFANYLKQTFRLQISMKSNLATASTFTAETHCLFIIRNLFSASFRCFEYV